MLIDVTSNMVMKEKSISTTHNWPYAKFPLLLLLWFICVYRWEVSKYSITLLYALQILSVKQEKTTWASKPTWGRIVPNEWASERASRLKGLKIARPLLKWSNVHHREQAENHQLTLAAFDGLICADLHNWTQLDVLTELTLSSIWSLEC